MRLKILDARKIDKTIKICGIVCLVTVAACSKYQVSVNERVVYEPPKLFSDYKIADPALKECTRATIEEQGLTRATQLTSLVCPDGSIANLSGIEVFTQLNTLGLANNRIEDIQPIAALSKLSNLNLKNNRVQNLKPLSLLSQLKFLDIRGNESLNCETIGASLDQALVPEAYLCDGA